MEGLVWGRRRLRHLSLLRKGRSRADAASCVSTIGGWAGKNRMHELSIAMSIVEMAQEEALQRGVQVNAVHLKLGALSGVVKEALLSSYEMACDDTPLQGSRLVIEDVAVVVFCPNCNAQRPLHSVQFFCCAECGTPTSEIVQGKELEVVALEIQ
jgi:hydrogenase nickel incorporation protein HypA/HybF